MKAIYKSIALAALALGAVACSQDEDFTSAYLSDPDAVRITAQVGDITGGFTRSNPIGTEDEQKKFNSGDKIGVSAGSQAAVVYTYDGSTWNPETDKYLKWESSPMNFTAWYPATDGTDAKNFTPQYNATTETEADTHLAELQVNDYMTYSGEQNNTNGNGVNLTMKRQMVRIVISDEISYNSQYDNKDNAVVAIAITAGSSKYENGVWTDGNITAQMYKHDGKWYAVLPPTATAKDNETFLSVTLNGVTEQLTVKGIPATKAGKSYDYTLTVGKNVATIGSVSVTDWTDGTIPGGEATEYDFTISGTVAVISEFYSSDESLITKAIYEIYETASNITDIVVNTTLTDEQQRAFATALSGKTAVLYLPQMTTENLVDELKNISVICPITDPSKTAKGDVALLDGTFIDVDDLDKLSKSSYLKSKVAGVVFWTTKDSNTGGTTPAKLTDDKVMMADYPNCIHGLIAALKDVTTSCKWQEQNSCESVYDAFQNTDLFTPTNKSDYASINSGTNKTNNCNKIFGYNNTKVLRAYNENCSSNGKSAYLVNPAAKLDEWKKSNKAPENTTDWYLPSEKELFMLCRKDMDDIYAQNTGATLTKNTVNTSLQKIGGSQFGSSDVIYWSSTEKEANVAFIVSFYKGGAAFKNKYYNYYVRAVCAF